jgi:hypothetical protein
MTVEILRSVLGWCVVINMGLLCLWFLMLTLAHDFIYRNHTRWLKMPVETFDTIHYAGIAFYKIVLFVFIFVPYVALLIVT